MRSVVVVAAQFLRQPHRDAGHAIAMTAGVRVFGVDRRGHRPHDAAEEVGLLLVQVDVAAVDAEDRADRREQVRFDGAELAGFGMIERGEPAEQPFPFVDGDDDELANVGELAVRVVARRRG